MKKLKKFLSCIDGQAAAVAAVMLVIGVLFIAFPEGSLKIVCYITGSVTLLWGAARWATRCCLRRLRRRCAARKFPLRRACKSAFAFCAAIFTTCVKIRANASR